MSSDKGDVAKPRVVIVGGGFGGLEVARALRQAPVHITVIDRNNHHLFQPLLYQVATAGLSPADIAAPIRSILRRQQNTFVLMADVIDINKTLNIVKTAENEYYFDYLIIATGSQYSYFGHDSWQDYAPGLKSLEDATQIRTQILLSFEKAEAELDTEKRNSYLTFVIIGGGPTGVEIAGSLVELKQVAL